jgi:hypothetical protein
MTIVANTNFQTRGEYNNNPLNLNYMASRPFLGQVGIEIIRPGHTGTPRFGRYNTAFNGVRAGAEQLMIDNTRHGLTTLWEIISDKTFGWAPESDLNDDVAYSEAVCKVTGFNANDPIDFTNPEILAQAWPGFCTVENGRCLYESRLITNAVRSVFNLPLI